ncbi:hypothetical protein [Methylomonas lenta]|nr:hypothetical protein [Methylomonas lenta]
MTSIKRHKPMIILAMATFLLFGYDMIFDLISSLFHVFIVIAHYLFEFCESSLDSIIEHLFHTSRRATQIIVFYIMTSILIAVGFLILRKVPTWSRKFREQSIAYFNYKKMQAIDFWRQQTLLLKIKLCSEVIAGISAMLFVSLS